jgi:hypothetical protein
MADTALMQEIGSHFEVDCRVMEILRYLRQHH